jgi:hypothetical protein
MEALAESIPLIDKDEEGDEAEKASDDSTGIDKEFEDYLNENEEYDTVVSSDSDDALNSSTGAPDEAAASASNEDFDEFFRRESENTKRSKLSKLESAEYSMDNLEYLRRLALDKYGFMNKKIRRKAWPILILSRNGKLIEQQQRPDAIPAFLTESINDFEQISNSTLFNNLV